MKKTILFLLLGFFIISNIKAQSFAQFTCYQRNGATIADSFQVLNLECISSVYLSGTKTYIRMTYPGVSAKDEFTSRQSVDTVLFYANKAGVNFVKFNHATTVSTTDSFLPKYYNVKSIIRASNAVTPGKTWSHTRMLYQEYNGNTQVPIMERYDRVCAVLDSAKAATQSNAGTVYDTSTYVMKSTDKFFVLNSTTNDTLTLMNPSQFAGRDPIVISNIGSGTYFPGGGFTFKDKSGSSVSILAANTVYMLKAYNTGAAYIWLKEY